MGIKHTQHGCKQRLQCSLRRRCVLERLSSRPKQSNNMQTGSGSFRRMADSSKGEFINFFELKLIIRSDFLLNDLFDEMTFCELAQTEMKNTSSIKSLLSYLHFHDILSATTFLISLSESPCLQSRRVIYGNLFLNGCSP